MTEVKVIVLVRHIKAVTNYSYIKTIDLENHKKKPPRKQSELCGRETVIVKRMFIYTT